MPHTRQKYASRYFYVTTVTADDCNDKISERFY